MARMPRSRQVRVTARLTTAMRRGSRRALLACGRRLSPRTVADLRSALGYVELGGWLQQLPGQPRPDLVGTRQELFARALANVTGERPLYLEFGVYEGDSFRWWLRHLTAPAARFVGFDSFQGLPEDWRPDQQQGRFRTDGPPDVGDSRASFVVGWFDETLPTFTPPGHDQLVVVIDCDLYSSTAVVLSWLEPHLRPGTLIYFDELPDRDHEMRAFFESLGRSGRKVTPLGIANGGLHWLLRYE